MASQARAPLAFQTLDLFVYKSGEQGSTFPGLERNCTRRPRPDFINIAFLLNLTHTTVPERDIELRLKHWDRFRMKGIVLSGGSGSRLYPITRAANKQLLPIFNKPMVYYPLTTLMQAGCREILIVVNPHDVDSYRRLFGDGRQWGLTIDYAVQPKPGGIAEVFLIGRGFIGEDRVGLVLGDNLFYGDSLPALVERGAGASGAVIYAYWVADPSAYGVIEFDVDGRPSGIIEKPKFPNSNWAVTGLYFYDGDVCDVATTLTRSARGELEITDVNTHYLEQGRLAVEKLGRGYAWLDTGTPSRLLRAAQFVETVEERQGLQIGSPEEVAWRKGYIDSADLARLIEPIHDSEYGKYLSRILARG